MDNTVIGLRAQDFHESLKLVAPSGPREVHFRRTLLIGKAASLAMHLRGLLFVDDISQLEYAAASLGITSLELTPVLRELEEVSFLSVTRNSDSSIKRVEVRVPEFRSGYADLGERWWQIKPTEIEQAAVRELDLLHRGPLPMMQPQALGLDPTGLSIMLDVMEAGQLIANQAVDGQERIFTPLAIDGNPSAYLRWAEKFPREVQDVTNLLRSSQGLPLTDPQLVAAPALADAVATGVLMPVQVTGATGQQGFVFAPHGGLKADERTILDKARAIVACVRYGQHFAKNRPIRYPRRIIETLIDNKRFKQGHPDLFAQYGLLVEKLIGHPVDEGNGVWNFRVDDTDENMKALRVAAEMIEFGSAQTVRIDIDAQKALLAPTGYVGPQAARPALIRTMKLSPRTQAEIIRNMADLARGMSPLD